MERLRVLVYRAVDTLQSTDSDTCQKNEGYFPEHRHIIHKSDMIIIEKEAKSPAEIY